MAETLTRADVQRIATLARLELTSEEIALFADQLTAILAFADQVRQVDTSGVEAGATVASADSTRPDTPVPSFPRDAVLDQAPDADRAAGVFKVPRVLGS
jgi:aspartyl-tRNA(Asn)/glutamyl-tRNA(Gln) amidotransferase subunit C